MAPRARASSTGQATHSSSCMAMSAPMRSAWISMDRSGLSAWREPSMWLAKVTASSLILAMPARDMTWKPPESVRIGPSQRMKRCSPPSRCRRSGPGRNMRW